MPNAHNLSLACAGAGALLLAGCAGPGPTATDASFSATYVCADGQHISAVYSPPERARITTPETTLDMQIARSADGARYVGGNRVWWTKGSGPGSPGTLFERGADDDATGALITNCEQIETPASG